MVNPVSSASDITGLQSLNNISIENQPKSSFFSRICSCFCKAKVDSITVSGKYGHLLIPSYI